MEAVGIATCHVPVGQKVYVQQFIVCRRMITPVILGRDFLSTYQCTVLLVPFQVRANECIRVVDTLTQRGALRPTTSPQDAVNCVK